MRAPKIYLQHHILWCQRCIFAINTTICGVESEFLPSTQQFVVSEILWRFGKQKYILKTLYTKNMFSKQISWLTQWHFLDSYLTLFQNLFDTNLTLPWHLLDICSKLPWYTGWHIHREPGNRVPMKCISSGKIFGRIGAMLQVDRASLTRESKFFWLELIFCDKKRIFASRITLL